MKLKVNNVLEFKGSQQQTMKVEAYLKNIGGINDLITNFEPYPNSIMPSCLNIEMDKSAGITYKALFGRKILPEQTYMFDAREYIMGLPEIERMESLALAIQFRNNICETGYATKESWSRATGYDYNEAPYGNAVFRFNSFLNPKTEKMQELSMMFPWVWFDYAFEIENSTKWELLLEDGEILDAIEV